MTHFRKRLSKEMLIEVNEAIAREAALSEMQSHHDDDPNGGTSSQASPESEQERVSTDGHSPTHRGTLLIDATCAPGDIHYPTDLHLLNEAREKLEHMIDLLHTPDVGQKKKPRSGITRKIPQATSYYKQCRMFK